MCTKSDFVPGFNRKDFATIAAVVILAAYGAIDLLIRISLFLIHAIRHVS